MPTSWPRKACRRRVFAQRLRQDISASQVLKAIEATALAPAAAASAALDAFLQQREVQVQRFEPSAFAAKVKPTDAETAGLLQGKRRADSRLPSRSISTIWCSTPTSCSRAINIDEEELRKYYAQNEARYSTPEERRASHILIKADQSSIGRAARRGQGQGRSPAGRGRARTRRRFAEVATKNSDDPGSAANGGDLDFFGKGAMVKPFEEAVFALQTDWISDVVDQRLRLPHHQADRYARRRKAQLRGGAARRSRRCLRKQLAQQKYTELAVEFSNIVYEQADSLKPAADKFKLELQTAKGLTRSPAPGATGPLASPKLLEAIFSTDAIRNKRNTDAIEIAPTQMVRPA